MVQRRSLFDTWAAKDQARIERQVARQAAQGNRPPPRWVRVVHRFAKVWSWVFLGWAALMVVTGLVNRSLPGVLIGGVLVMLASLRLAGRKWSTER